MLLNISEVKTWDMVVILGPIAQLTQLHKLVSYRTVNATPRNKGGGKGVVTSSSRIVLEVVRRGL